MLTVTIVTVDKQSTEKTEAEANLEDVLEVGYGGNCCHANF